MNAFWLGAGIVILGFTLLDVFLTALNYDEAGFLAGRLAAWQWALIRRATRRMSRRWRPMALRQVTGLQIMLTVCVWLVGVIIGFGLIYLGLMYGKSFTYDGVRAGPFGALYFSAAQLATVGTSQLTPNTDLLRVLSILETLTGVVLVSLILTFLLGIYAVISSLRSLSVQFFSAGRGVGEPIASLAPYFPDGQSRGLDSHLQSVSDAFSSYADGIRLHHAAYYFQSGRDTFSLPYSIRMLAGITGGLRWGLPKGHPVTQEPTLLPLTEQFENFRRYMHPLLRWTSADVPETVDPAEFRRQLDADARGRGDDGRHRRKRAIAIDPWVARFIQVNTDMAELVHDVALTDIDEAYDRYVEWLPFAYRSQQFSAAIIRDLDYQPIYSETTEEPPTSVLVPAPAERSHVKERPLRAFMARRLTLVDPGNSRLFQALRAVGSAAVTVLLLSAVFTALALPVMPAAVFGGMIAMFVGNASAGSPRGLARLRGLAAAGPVLMAVILNAVVPHEWTPAAGAVLVALAFVGVGASRFGRAVGGLGQLLFVSYYFTLLMHLKPGEFLLFGAAGLTGVVVATLVQLLPSRNGRRRVVLDGIRAFELRIVRVIEPLIDTVSAARWDPDLIRRVRSELRRTHRTAAFLTGQLNGADGDLGLSADQAATLTMRVFDAELAVVHVAEAAKAATGSRIPLEVRAQLAGDLESFQGHVRAYPRVPQWMATGGADAEVASGGDAPSSESIASRDAPDRWPEPARMLVKAVVELQRATDAVQTARSEDLLQSPVETQPSSDQVMTVGPEPPVDVKHSGTPGSGALRRAIQAALSTGLALLAGSSVSINYQYWAAMPAYQTIGGTDGETYTKGARRILGTILGAAVGFGIAIGSEGNPAVVLPTLAVCVFATAYFRSASSPLTSFWQTMMFAQLYEFLGKLSAETVELRVAETAIGAAIALIVTALVLPTRTSARLAQDSIRLVKSVQEVTDLSIRRWRGGTAARGVTIAGLQKKELEMSERLRAVQVTAAPLRRTSGSLDPRGIEARLTAYWALLYYTRHFVAATLSAHERARPVTPDRWEQLGTATDGNFAALEAVLDKRVSLPVQPDIGLADLSDVELEDSTERALRSLQRINETIALLVDNSQLEDPLVFGPSRRPNR